MITSDDVFHIKNVLRMKSGDEIIVSDGVKSFYSKIIKITADAVFYEITKEIEGNYELPFFLTLFQGYPKGDKMDDIIKNTTQLGISEIYPVLSKRSVVKIEDSKKESKLARFRKIAKESAEQSERNKIPSIPNIISFKEIDVNGFDLLFFAYEKKARESETSDFKEIIKSIKPNMKVGFFVGPEGGIDDVEANFLIKMGFKPIGLGSRILRTEMASLYVISAISYEWEL